MKDAIIFFILVSLTVCALSDSNKRYITYTVNYGEGFNLRRDVYMRVVELVLALRKDTNLDWTLILPPWPRLYHWKTNGLYQNWLPWNRFFDVNELSKIVPCIEFTSYLDMEGNVIDEVLQLQQLEEMFVDGRYVETAEERECIDKDTRSESVFGYDHIHVKHSCCVSAQGQVSVMKQFLQRRKTIKSFMIKNFEKLLHDDFGGVQYWRSTMLTLPFAWAKLIRKSMVYSPALIKAGNQFMIERLAYNPRDDNGHPLQGGNYIGAHLRRRDFLYSRRNTVPSLEGVVSQLNILMQELKLTTVFIASDESMDDEFQKSLNSLQGDVYYYTPTSEELQTYGDGGVAIIDQWILSHARYFIGTADSTFSYRVREERQVMGFTNDSTFNDLCGPSHDETNPHSCPEPTKWLLVNSEDRGGKIEL